MGWVGECGPELFSGHGKDDDDDDDGDDDEEEEDDDDDDEEDEEDEDEEDLDESGQETFLVTNDAFTTARVEGAGLVGPVCNFLHACFLLTCLHAHSCMYACVYTCVRACMHATDLSCRRCLGCGV